MKRSVSLRVVLATLFFCLIGYTLWSFIVSKQETSSSERFAEPVYFVDGTENLVLLEAIKDAVNEEIDFNQHYSTAHVSCGTACISSWFVDRRDGGIIESPDMTTSSEEMIWKIESQAMSDEVKIIYGSSDGTGNQCWTQTYHLDGQSFVPTTKKETIDCPI